jgi:3-deoxy-manno-octulosonate cytidylyltransferase (CMP-KDO synthetase)
MAVGSARDVLRTLAIIPARLGSTRLPRKPLLPLAGRPLILRVRDRVLSLGVASRCVVATDSEEVARVVEADGGEVAMTSPDHATGTERVAEVAATPGFEGFTAILNVQGDEPFVEASAIEGSLRLLSSGRFQVATAAAPVEEAAFRSPNVVKVVAADDGRALYFSRAAIPFLRDESDGGALPLVAHQHIGVYAYTPRALQRWVALPEHPLERVERLEQLRALAGGIAIGVAMIADPPRGGIDTQDDLDRANEYWTLMPDGR